MGRGRGGGDADADAEEEEQEQDDMFCLAGLEGEAYRLTGTRSFASPRLASSTRTHERKRNESDFPVTHTPNLRYFGIYLVFEVAPAH